MDQRNDVAVILVGYNSRNYLVDCLRSLRESDWHGYRHEIICVDNASSDGTVDVLRQEWPEVKVIVNEQNNGFCKACNQGVEISDSRYIYLMNVDTLAFPDSIWRLVEFLDQNPSAAAAGNRLLNADMTEQWSARRFPNWRNGLFGRRSWLGKKFPNSRPVRAYLYKDELESGKPFAVDWIPGSCTLIRREAYDKVGGLPQEMHYWSDSVFCDRVRRLCGEIFIVPEARLIHFEGNSTGIKSGAVRRWLIQDFHRGAYQFYCGHRQLGPYSPRRWIAKGGLSLRASLLIALDAVRHAGSAKAQANRTQVQRPGRSTTLLPQ